MSALFEELDKTLANLCGLQGYSYPMPGSRYASEQRAALTLIGGSIDDRATLPAMKKLFDGKDPVEPYLIRDWLTRNSIFAEIRGVSLLGLGGGIPVQRSFPTIWVPEHQLDEAQRLLDLYRAPTLVHPEWTCDNCGETNAPSFGSCWNCQTEA